MHTFRAIASRLQWMGSSLHFIRKHFVVLLSLGLISAFGRAIQLRAFGEISTSLHITLEVIIESARVLLFLYVLGFANISKGALRIGHLFTRAANRKQNWVLALSTLKTKWFSLLLNLIAFSLIAFAINYWINITVYETCFYINMKTNGVLSQSSSEWVMILFLKNLSVIPFTLVFNALFLLWVTRKLENIKPGSPAVAA